MKSVLTINSDNLFRDNKAIAKAISEENLDVLFDTLSSCIENRFIFIEFIPEKISRWSKEAVKYFGLPGVRLKNAARIWASFIIEEERENYLKKLDELESGETDTLEYIMRVRNADGNYQTTGCKARLIRNDKSEPLFFVGSIRNYERPDTVDPVTGLFSRTNLIYTIKRYLQEEKPFVVAEVGIRNYFDFNSMYGFDEGNKVLKKVASWLQNSGAHGVFFRGDGTKFIYMVREDKHTKGEIHRLFKGLKNYLKKDIVIDGLHTELDLCGGAMRVTDMSLDASSVYNSVQYAMAQAKDENRMELLVYNDEMQRKSRSHLSTLNKIRNSITNGCNGFYMVYQPIVAAEDEKLVGMEALIRYRDETGKVVPPNSFIPWLEKDAAFYELGSFIIRTAINDAKKIIKYDPDFIVNINLAYPQLQRVDFKTDLKKIIDDEGFDAKNLKLELTERCKLLDVESLRNDMVYFKSSGMQTALDDFGTGYSALGLLISLPVDQIKIDKSFIDDIESDVPRQCLLEAITNCAARLNINCCVEGIETEDKKDYLRDNFKITSFQGYYYSKP
nr:EAL domain-containing protein [Lachnospiraceae bacterium]